MENKKTQNLKGFSLTEILVAMAIIAAIMGLALVSLRILTRNGRDAQRVETINLLKVEFEKVYLARGRYPNGNSDVRFNNGDWTICQNPPTCSEIETIPAADSHLSQGLKTSEQTTLYCYFTGTDSTFGYNVSGEYVMGIQKENGDWIEVGTSNSVTCEQMMNDDNLDLLYLPNGDI